MAVQVSSAMGARDESGQAIAERLDWVAGATSVSLTVMLVRGTLPVLVTTKTYEMVFPTAE